MDVASSKIRAFVAIYPKTTVVGQLESLQNNLRKGFLRGDIRWTRTEQLHLTLHFLGYIKTTQLVEFESVIDTVSGKYPPFQLVAEKLGCFPSQKSPRILWTGLSGDIAILQKIKDDLSVALAPLGYVPEKREFHPHLTLARFGELKRKEMEQLTREIVLHEAKKFGEWRVEKIDLMQSVLSSTGANYRVLRSFSLNRKK